MLPLDDVVFFGKAGCFCLLSVYTKISLLRISLPGLIEFLDIAVLKIQLDLSASFLDILYADGMSLLE